MKKWCVLLMTLLLILTTAVPLHRRKWLLDLPVRRRHDVSADCRQGGVRESRQSARCTGGYVRRRADGADAGAAALCGGRSDRRRRAGRDLLHDGAGWNAPALRVAWWTGDGYQMVDKVVGEDFSLDTVHVSAGEVSMEVEGQEYALKLRNGKLVLWYTAGRKIVYIQPHAIGNMEEVIAMRNDSYVYGAHPFYNVEAVDFAAFPETYAEMLAQVDSTNWAVVNNPNPTDRLHLRTEPDRKSVALGKFYNRTPVYVDEIRGEWAHVTIGRDLSGWMMTKYLAFGEEMDKVKGACPQLSLIEKYQENVADELAYDYYVFDAPNWSAEKTLWNWGEECYLIGVIDDFYMIMDTDENVRYIPQDWLWAGNG